MKINSSGLIFGNQGLDLSGSFIFGQGGKKVDPAFITTWQTTTAAESITLPLVSTGTYDMVVDWGDGSSDTITAHTDAARIHEYATAGAYEVRIEGTCKQWNFYDVPASKDKILDVKNWGAFAVGSGTNAFRSCSNLDITAPDAPDMTGVTSFSLAFYQCASLVGGTGFNLWDVSSVTDMSNMLRDTPFNQDIGGWDVSSVTDMSFMLRETPFDQDLGSWDVSAVTNMSYMFRETPFNQDIGAWDVSSVTSMRGMFYQSSSFNQDIGAWDVSSVTNMREMLRETPFDQDIGAWDVSSVTNMSLVLLGNTLSTANYDSLLNGWASQTVQPDLSFHGGNSTYSSAAADARDTLTSAPNNWTITDGGQAP